jgi:hypothetical protein
MAQQERGCGTRVKGALYAFFAMEFVETCPNLPLPLPEVCPVCGEGIHRSRSIRYVIPDKLLPKVKEKCKNRRCPICEPSPDLAGLMWVGDQYYTAAQFIEEALSMGISKRIAVKPEKLKVGDLVYFVHPHAIRIGNAVFDESEAPRRGVKHSTTKPGIFLAAHLTAYHKIIDEKEATDEKFVQSLEDQGITPVIEELPTPISYQPEKYSLPKHILIKDDTPRDIRVGLPYRATCPACDRIYGYSGKNPRYCPDCLASRNKREVDALANKAQKKKKTTKSKKKTKKVTTNGSS